MDEISAGPIIKRVRDDLEKAADDILEESKNLAEANMHLSNIKDQMARLEAKLRAEISTATNKETGRPRFPNVDSQNAAVVVRLNDDETYQGERKQLVTLIYDIELSKAKLVRLHEKRKDLRTEADLMVGLLKS